MTMSINNQVEQRIIYLLSETEMTFKQIISQLDSENIHVSFNTIRQVNRDYRYRRPRYESRFTLKQREELVMILKKSDKPNLSSLAKQYGVCYGSIWYYWDKLNKAKQLEGSSGNTNSLRENSDSISGFIDDISENNGMNDNGHDDGEHKHDQPNMSSTVMGPKSAKSSHDKYNNRKLIGRVQAISSKGDLIGLPILMFTKVESPM